MSGEENSQSDPELLDLQHRYKNGDGEALGLLIDRLKDNSRFQILRIMSGNEHNTEDVFSETTKKLLDPDVRARYDPARPWLPWASTVLRNTANDQCHKQADHKQETLDVDRLPAPTPPDDDLRCDLDDCLERLPPDLRDLLVQRFLNGRRQNEIAQERHWSGSMVSRAMDRARTLLAECLRNKGHGERLR
jgi:RNA polymerase sigma factor (sigma-70 family)